MNKDPQNPYTKSMRRNPNNTGSIYCAKNVKGWSETTHFEYYKEDPQVALGGALLMVFCFIIAICFIFIWPKFALIGVPLGIFLGLLGGKSKNGKNERSKK